MIVANAHLLAIEHELDGHGLHFVKVWADLKERLLMPPACHAEPHRSGVECFEAPTWAGNTPRRRCGVRRGTHVGRKHSAPSVWSAWRHPRGPETLHTDISGRVREGAV